MSDLERSIDSFLDVLRAQVDEVERERAELKAEYQRSDAELKASVAKAKRLISANARPDAKPAKPKKGRQAGEKRLDALETYLRASVNGSEFMIPELRERDDWIGVSDSYASSLLNVLHERGVVRLVRTGHPTHGARTKTWRLVDAK